MLDTQATSEVAITAALAQNWKEAIRINLAILTQRKNDIDALNRLGFAYLQSGQITAAKKTFQKVISLDPYNQIANRNLKKLTTLKRKNLSPSPQKLSPLMFLEDPGKTKIVGCVNLAPVQVLSTLYAGQAVELRAKNHCVEIRDQKNIYLGALPDDLSFKLIKLMSGGNRYQALIKGISKNSLTVFLREIYRGKRFAHQPSFISSTGFISNIRPKTADLP
ncbi:MAG: tetratricopeptide repeat protein, partial [Patescibacteria group bacterium]